MTTKGHDVQSHSRWDPPTVSQLRGIPGLTIQSLLGRGGMGAVYLARQNKDDRLVALKVARPTTTKGRATAFKAQVIHEAQVMARLNHPHIVKVYNFGETNHLVWVVMEFVEGLTLRQLLRAHQVSPNLALILSRQLCDALAHIHSRGVIHQDLKPENVVVDNRSQAKIVDFGLANVQDFSYTVARPGRTSGTPSYMAPEQKRHPRDLDYRSDIYALGVILFEMVTGHLPTGPNPLPPQYSGACEALDQIIIKCLKYNPNDRWQSASALRDALQKISWEDARRMSVHVSTDIIEYDSSTIQEFLSATPTP